MNLLSLYHIALKILNFIVPIKNEFVYAVPHTNCTNDCYDIVNYGSDNLLCVLNALARHESTEKTIVYLECYDRERLKTIRDYCKTICKNNVFIVPVLSHNAKGITESEKKRLKFKNQLKRFRCKTWLTDTVYCYYPEKLKHQLCLCMNYSTPLKLVQKNTSSFDFSFIDGLIETSQLTAMVHAAEFSIDLQKCIITGFARNDTLFKSNKTDAIKKWIASKTDVNYTKILVYAPTYRDYEGAYKVDCIFGFADPNGIIEKTLEQLECIVIVKMHPLQEVSDNSFTKRIIQYEANYDFGLYDLLALSNMLISDYSSVIHDYIITNKPVVLDFFDREQYDNDRGFAFQPLDFSIPSIPVDNAESFVREIKYKLEVSEVGEKHKEIRKMFHKYNDSNSTKRCVNYLLECFKE